MCVRYISWMLQRKPEVMVQHCVEKKGEERSLYASSVDNNECSTGE